MTPASLVKLITTYLVIEKWGLEHRFTTHFYLHEHSLWVKGFGDPYLISEELDLVAEQLNSLPNLDFQSINMDIGYFEREPLPGGSKVSDPYNAPLSALAANFNTVMLRRDAGKLVSAEDQTPLTNTARQLARNVGNKPVRVNLQNADIAQQQFAEILLAKMGRQGVVININRATPAAAKLVYTHENSHSLAQMLRGALQYSNNFVTNQLYLLLGENLGATMQFAHSTQFVRQQLNDKLAWPNASIVDGSGLSRDNKASARQLLAVLQKLDRNTVLLKQYPLKLSSKQNSATTEVIAFAKTGTLSGVHNLAGVLEIGVERYYFVFMFNRPRPSGYREQLLQGLANQLQSDK
jgi:D-alanyl-D-alanine carboxypeptidase/D-alanyl-D-alanine-endopeptidase (penicillin-binding protein 4)